MNANRSANQVPGWPRRLARRVATFIQGPVRYGVPRYGQRTLTRVLPKLFRYLELRSAAKVKEQLSLVGTLDYKPRSISMVVHSTEQIKRLKACKKEPETVAWLEAQVQPGDVLYDIGANVGAYSLVAHAIAKGRCTIYAVEPSFSTFDALSRNVFLNHAQEAIFPIHVGLGERTELSRFSFSSILPGAALHNARDAGPNGNGGATFAQSILSFRLDDLVTQFGLQPPTLLKVDVDGPELQVLRGARECLGRSSLRSVLIEIDEEDPEWPEALSILSDHGFRVASRVRRSRAFHNYVFERERPS